MTDFSWGDEAYTHLLSPETEDQSSEWRLQCPIRWNNDLFSNEVTNRSMGEGLFTRSRNDSKAAQPQHGDTPKTCNPGTIYTACCQLHSQNMFPYSGWSVSTPSKFILPFILSIMASFYFFPLDVWPFWLPPACYLKLMSLLLLPRTNISIWRECCNSEEHTMQQDGIHNNRKGDHKSGHADIVYNLAKKMYFFEYIEGIFLQSFLVDLICISHSRNLEIIDLHTYKLLHLR